LLLYCAFAIPQPTNSRKCTLRYSTPGSSRYRESKRTACSRSSLKW
jgi:hypothetical protein